jgi:hypothetical protein
MDISQNPSPEREKIDKYLQGIPVSAKGVVKRAFAGSGSPRNAIKAKCLACSNWDRQEITECRVFTCPLHVWRPFQAKAA